MRKLNLKTSHKAVRDYYIALEQFSKLNITHEGAVRSAFQSLLEKCYGQFKWKLLPEWKIKLLEGRSIWVDGALVDNYKLAHGYWEAKESKDNLKTEVQKKFALGYPKNNILFQEPERAILWQDGIQIVDEDITRDTILVEILREFFEYRPPEFAEWEEAVEEFKNRVPELAARLVELIERERKTNTPFIDAFKRFMELCKQSINPNLSENAIEEMLIQHLLTERIFRRIFENPEFAHKNVIAAEIEKVVNALTSQTFSRHEFMKDLSHFYGAIEKTSATIHDFAHKQHFLNTVYEKFFQGFSVKVADTHGIVYTPQPIVNFMVKSVVVILNKEFGKSLSDKGVHIIDPFVGTGNFIVRIMQEINKIDLTYKYENELHCNEVMLLPYYIASMNIEHEYFEQIKRYKSFEGICLVDTFELAEADQQVAELFNEENTERVYKQKETPIFIIIGNPPYNANQVNENDNNKNRIYEVIDKRVSDTYGKDSKATLLSKLHDPYVKAIRWASDRLGKEGIVAFVSNYSFVHKNSFDGMRKHLSEDFDCIYILDLGGDVRKNPKLSGTTHNVFGDQIGISINLFIKKSIESKIEGARIYYSRVDEFWRKKEKYKYLEKSEDISNIKWQSIKQDKNYTWITEGLQEEFETFVSIGNKETKASKDYNVDSLFKIYGVGLATQRDAWVYNFNRKNLISNVKRTIEAYNEQVFRLKNIYVKNFNVDEFLEYENDKISWSRRLKNYLKKGEIIEFSENRLRYSLYRPFRYSYLYFDHHLNDQIGQTSNFFPTAETEFENRVICLSGIGSTKTFQTLITSIIPSLDLLEKTQCFPFYTYAEDGRKRRENITDWALEQFQVHYKDNNIKKWDIFYYVYGLLHHPSYSNRYAANLRRELPRIPFAPDFRAFAQAGEKLAELHINYEKQYEFPLEKIENPEKPLNWRVEKMKLSKDKSYIKYNDFLTLSGIPINTFEYRLGNRSALEWIIDQYRVKTDKRSGIVSDPNRADDEQYIVRLISRVVTVSLKTVEIVESLQELGIYG